MCERGSHIVGTGAVVHGVALALGLVEKVADDDDESDEEEELVGFDELVGLFGKIVVGFEEFVGFDDFVFAVVVMSVVRVFAVRMIDDDAVVVDVVANVFVAVVSEVVQDATFWCIFKKKEKA
jgi:hypothetical protein